MSNFAFLATDLLQKSNFFKPFNLIWVVQPPREKFFAFAVGQIISTSSPRPASSRGAFRDRHGRWVRDAMDALAAQDERSLKRTAKSCGPDIPMLISNWRRCLPSRR
jgi:hypothetical protein